MSPIALIIKREVLVKIRSKAYVIGTLAMALVGAGLCWVFKLVGSNLSGLDMGMADSASQAANEVLAKYGLTEAEFTQMVAQRTAEIQAESGGMDFVFNGPGYAIGLVTCVILMITIIQTGTSIAMGVVEEKSSRVVEILLASLRPRQLMAGKVLGIGLMGLVQVIVIVAATGISAYATGMTDFLFNSGVDLTSAIIWAVVWFIVGYFSFACLFAAVGSMVAKPEEVHNAAGPLVIIIMLGYFSAIYLTVGAPSLGGGFSMLAEIIKYVPLVNVLAMSSGLAAGTVSNVDGFIALGISLVFIPLLIWLGGKIYSYSILQTGSKVKLLKVFR